jgi:hypothetical protein
MVKTLVMKKKSELKPGSLSLSAKRVQSAKIGLTKVFNVYSELSVLDRIQQTI